MSRDEYIKWHQERYGYSPKRTFLDKHFPKIKEPTEVADIEEATEKDWQEFWEGM